MESFQHVILGGGMVAGYAAKEFVEHGIKPGELAIVSSDSALPYERPPLSKGYLAGRDSEESVFISPAGFYKEHGIAVRLKSAAVRVDPNARTIRLGAGEQYRFENLIIATGARPRTFHTPGASLDGVRYLRSLDDSRRIRDESKSARQVVVIGGGFIAMETAAVLAQRGLETTLAFSDDRIWKRLFTPEVSSFFRRYYESRGVQFAPGATVAAFSGTGRVNGVWLTGGRRLPADLVVAGIGVVPATEMLDGSGLRVDNGVVVNEYLEASAPGVYAAGDVANYHDTLFGGQRRVEHWDNAVKQGQHVARVLSGDRQPFENVPYFFSDMFDLSWEFWGDSSRADRAVTRGDFGGKSFSVWWLEHGRVAAALVMSRPDEERELAQTWIRERAEIAPETLVDASRPLQPV